MRHFSRWVTLWLALALSAVSSFFDLVPQCVPALCAHWFSPTQVALGEELQGQSRILFEVSRQDVIDGRVATIRDEIRAKLRGARIGYVGLRAGGQAAEVRIRGAADIERAKAALADLLSPASSEEAGANPVNEVIFEEPEPGFFSYTPTDTGIDHRIASAAKRSVEVIEHRLYDLAVADSTVEARGADRISVEVNGRHDHQRLTDILARTGKLTFQWVDQSMPVEEAINARPPAGLSVAYTIGEPPLPYLVEDRVAVSGDHIVDAQAAVDQVTNEPVVNFRFDREGRRLFGEATSQNVGRILAVMLDGQVISAPVVREPILGGSGQISGNFTMQAAEDFALLFWTGAHPAKLDVIEVRFTPTEP